VKGETAARQRLEALEARVGQPTVPLPPTSWQLRDQMRQTLENAHAEGLLEQAVHQIKVLYKCIEPDPRGFMMITGGARAETWDADCQFARDDDARFNFTVIARYAKTAAPELIAYHFNLAFPGTHAPAFVRFDCNEAHFADASRNAALSPLRCHTHPGHGQMTVPSPVLSPVEVLDIILRQHLRS
jgi:hypothetical protein